jgi:hypothetical protein
MVIAGLAHAWAQDFDIVSSDRERHAAATPFCSAHAARGTTLNAEQKYQGALCRMYGIGEPVQRDKALETLRELALQGHAAAQLALADSLQGGTPAEMREALQWYERAGAANEPHIRLRHMRLAQRLSQMEPAPDSQPIDGPVPFDDMGDPVARPPGYHCHGFGRRQVCHGAMDY